MELTPDQALKKGIEAHRAGQFQEADQFYTAILKVQPKHADANHNMGVLAVSIGAVTKALPFFKTALEANPKMAQYWLSYIDALIKMDRIQDAKAVLDQAKSKGAKGNRFNQLEKKLCSSNSIKANLFRNSAGSLKEHINTLYTSLRSEVLNNVATGWLYDLRFDQNFLAEDHNEIYVYPENNNKDASANKKQKHYPVFKPNNIIAKLNAIADLKVKFQTLETLNTSEKKILFADSFSKSSSFDLRGVQKKIFKKNQLNVVIIGAGPCGLYLSNALKHQLKHKINILVLDNHCDERHFKKPFSRRWLSHLPIKYFDKYFDPDIEKLASSFGKDGYIGLPINLIEILLLISSKKNGVKFYFDKQLDFSVFSSSLIDLVFDASGGRIPNTKQQSPLEQEIKFQIPNFDMNFSYAGVKNLPVENVNSNGKILVNLKEDGFYHYPHFNGTRLFLRMMKLTQVPTSLHPNLMKFVQNVNNNRFYIWKGELADNINEILVIINLTLVEYEYFRSMITDMKKLSFETVEKALENKKLGQDLIDCLKMCTKHNNEEICMNAPFVYRPSVNLRPLEQNINGIEVYPVGDSLFKGNPKVGNGLGTHLRFITKLVETITSRQT